MAPPHAITVVDPLPWSRSMVTRFALSKLVHGGQLAPNVDGQPPTWIVPPAADREPNPPFGYVISFIHHHERGFAALASRFMRGLCYHYDVELHNFTLLMQNPHLAPITQQAEQASLTHEQIPKRASQFFLKLTKGNVVRCQSLELAGWYQTVPYLRLESHVR
jgi:hypothetical protein